MRVAIPDLADLFEPLAEFDHVAVAVSGGSDSVCLMHLAARWSAARGGRPRLSVLTVDHRLRPGSQAEAGQVRTWANRLGLAHATLSRVGPRPVTAVQEKARRARYDLLAAWCQGNGAEALLTGHTLDDQAETVLMRMARTSAIESIAGIPPQGSWQGVPVFRPLLGIPREALRDELRVLGQPWCEDPGNDDERFERVRMRRALVHLASQGIPAALLADLATRCHRAAEDVDRFVHAFLAHQLRVSVLGHGELSTAALLALPPGLGIRVLRRLLGMFGGARPVPRAGLTRLLAALAEPGARRTLGGAVIWRRRDHILLAREAGRIPSSPVMIPEDGWIVWDGRFVVRGPAGWQVVPALRVQGAGQRIAGIPRLVRDAQPVVLDTAGRPVPVGFGESGEARAHFLHLKSR